MHEMIEGGVSYVETYILLVIGVGFIEWIGVGAGSERSGPLASG